MNILRGEPELLTQFIPIAEQVERYGKRADGSHKGPGYFGQVATEDELECYTTEMPIAVPGPLQWEGEPLGGSRLIPLVVPTLTRAELAHLVAGGLPTLGMKQKAIAHACSRLAFGKSPFASLGEQHKLPQLEGTVIYGTH